MVLFDIQTDQNDAKIPVSASKWDGILDSLHRRKTEILCEAHSAKTGAELVAPSIEITLKLSERKRRELFQISLAISRIFRNEYGDCEVCDEEISRSTLHRFPYVRLCEDCIRGSRNLPMDKCSVAGVIC